MSPSDEAAKACPNCGGELSYIEEFKRYYCLNCEDFVAPKEEEVKEEVAEEAEDEKEEEVEEKVKEEIKGVPEETGGELVKTKEEEADEAKKRKIPPPPPPESKKKLTNYRYRTRMLKGSILPILYGVISIQMLNRYIYVFPDYFKYEMMMILVGFLIGVGGMSGITLINLIRAKKNPEEGCELKFMVGIVIYLPFIIILLALAFFYGLSTAWQFSTGFFVAPIFPLIFVTLFEVGTKGKFFVQEVKDDPTEGRRLIFTQ